MCLFEDGLYPRVYTKIPVLCFPVSAYQESVAVDHVNNVQIFKLFVITFTLTRLYFIISRMGNSFGTHVLAAETNSIFLLMFTKDTDL